MPLQNSSAHWNGGRVTVLTDFLSDFAGTERYTTTLCDVLATAGVTVEVFTAEPTRDDTWKNLLAARGITVHTPASTTATAALWAKLNQHIAARQPDVVLVNPMGDAFVQWLSSIPSNLPIPSIVGVEYCNPGPLSAHWYPPSLARMIHHIEAVITTCNASWKGVTEHFGYRGPIYVIPHLIYPPHSLPMPAVPRHHLGLVARLSVEKGIDYALAAVALLRRDGTAVELSVYGAGTEADRLAELAACLGIRCAVHLRGTFHPVEELDETLTRHAVWLQPSLFESVPTSLLELIARRRTVIATDVGGVSEVFEWPPHAHDLLVPPADTRTLADRIRSVLLHTEHYDRISEALQQRVLTRHAPQSVVPQLLDVLRRHGQRTARSWQATSPAGLSRTAEVEP
jgi:glycosyltransferase involved in cell wall biosynthesis